MRSQKTARVMNKRRTIIVCVCVGFWAALVARLFYLQVISYESYKSAVADNIERETVISASRGTIFDRNMVPLATNETVYRVFIAPNCIKTEEERKFISSRLSEILKVDYDEIYARACKENRADETIKKNVDSDTADEVRAFINENTDNGYARKIHLEASEKRFYPYGSLGSSVIGLAGTDSGLSGIEIYYDEYLKGTTGRYITAKNGKGGNMPFKYDTYIDALNGYNVVSTLDQTIEGVLCEQLEEAYNNSKPLRRVTGVVMNPSNGEVYGMATYPTFDLSDPYTLDADSQKKLDESGYAPDSDEYKELKTKLTYELWRNKAVNDTYEPGSTFKPVTTAIALENNVTTLDEEYTCTGSLTVEGWSKPIHCHKLYGHGTHPYSYMLQQSCNPTLMQVAAKIGLDRFYSYFEAFGYTSKTGIDLPGESQGIYNSYSAFTNVNLAVYSFGQTFTTTPIQQLSAICSIANGGYIIRPHVVKSLVDDDGNVVADFSDSVKYQIVSEDVCKKISAVLEEGVAGDGGAKNTRVTGYKIAAKTGTSEDRTVLDEEGKAKYVICSTVAYAPSDDPQVAVIIVVDAPTEGSLYGSYIAAPFVANVLEEILPYLGVDRDGVDTTVTVSNFVNEEIGKAKANADALGLKAEVVGGGATVLAQVPAAGSWVANGGRIIFYTAEETPTNDIEVPNLTNMSGSAATYALNSLGLNIYISGSTENGAYVNSQSVSPGTMVTRGTVVRVDTVFTSGLSDG